MIGRWFKRRQPKLSIIVNFYNMRREAARTLYSLTPTYQQDVDAGDYEVIALDNGSPEPLDGDWVQGFGSQFTYRYVDTRSPSPCMALNAAVRDARGEWIMCCIDGARILSPGILHYTLLAAGIWPHAFIYTTGMHLGDKLQNQAVLEGYDQQVEDELLASVNWRNDGYQLFRIACLAGSTSFGFFREKSESNCFAMRRADYLNIGGFDEDFALPGGGLCNLDLFNRVHLDKRFQPVLLVGEATFHQFHGGAATNVPPDRHPWNAMVEEYQKIRGVPYAKHYRRPVCLGAIHEPFEPVLKVGRDE